MRVISGSAKGKKLSSPPGLEVRPTADRFKEALFSMIGSDCIDAGFLDLFSGSGAIGIEALSRGAQCCTFVEISKISEKYIERNLKNTRLWGKSKIMSGDVLRVLNNLQPGFDIIFMDPPYGKAFIGPTLSLILEHRLLKEDGYAIAEHGNNEPPAAIDGLEVFKIKEYKSVGFVFYRYSKG